MKEPLSAVSITIFEVDKYYVVVNIMFLSVYRSELNEMCLFVHSKFEFRSRFVKRKPIKSR